MIKGKIDARRLLNSDPTIWEDVCIGPVQFRPSSLWPRAHSSYHRYSSNGGDDSSVYKKFKDPLLLATESEDAHEHFTDDDMYKKISQREIEMCERLRQHPHPNIAKYKGVECRTKMVCRRSNGVELFRKFDSERVVKIVFKRYSSSLHDWVLAGKPISLTECLTSIAHGIRHMHSLGLVHCDIKPDNIFVDSGSSRHISYVVGDFDSTALEGSVYELKGGTSGWTKDKEFDEDPVEEDDDWYAFDITKKWLISRYNRRERDYDHIGGPGRVRRS
jgi:serine/threonine protein kinase